MTQPHLYFAYGSNLHPEQMEDRCPGSKVFGSALLKDYRLAFRGDSRRWGGGGVATIIPQPGSAVPGVLYEMSPENVLALDKWEGSPRIYRQMPITVLNEQGTTQSAFSYQMNESPLTGPPSMRYFHQIWQNYKRFCLEEHHLMEAIEETLALMHAD